MTTATAHLTPELKRYFEGVKLVATSYDLALLFLEDKETPEWNEQFQQLAKTFVTLSERLGEESEITLFDWETGREETYVIEPCFIRGYDYITKEEADRRWQAEMEWKEELCGMPESDDDSPVQLDWIGPL